MNQFTQKKDAIDLFTSLYDANSTSISVTFANAPATLAADKDRALIELDLAVPTTIDTPDFDPESEHVASLNIEDIKNISLLRRNNPLQEKISMKSLQNKFSCIFVLYVPPVPPQKNKP